MMNKIMKCDEGTFYVVLGNRPDQVVLYDVMHSAVIEEFSIGNKVKELLPKIDCVLYAEGVYVFNTDDYVVFTSPSREVFKKIKVDDFGGVSYISDDAVFRLYDANRRMLKTLNTDLQVISKEKNVFRWSPINSSGELKVKKDWSFDIQLDENLLSGNLHVDDRFVSSTWAGQKSIIVKTFLGYFLYRESNNLKSMDRITLADLCDLGRIRDIYYDGNEGVYYVLHIDRNGGRYRLHILPESGECMNLHREPISIDFKNPILCKRAVVDLSQLENGLNLQPMDSSHLNKKTLSLFNQPK